MLRYSVILVSILAAIVRVIICISLRITCLTLFLLALPIVSMATDANNATIVIDENDNARGIFQLSSTTFSASEGDTSAITVSRTAGTYGEVYIICMYMLL